MTPPTLKVARAAMLGKINAIEPKISALQVTSAVGSTTTAKINGLGYRPDNSFKDTHWLVLPNGPSGSGILETQVVSAFDQDDGSNTVVTVSDVFTGIVQSGVTAYVSPINPEDIKDALNSAAGLIFPAVYVPRRYHHIQGSRAFNGVWDFWESGLPVWWSKSDSALTVNQKSTTPYAGVYYPELVADGSARYLGSDPIDVALLQELAGQSVTFHCLMLTSSAADGGVTIRDGGGVQTTVDSAGGGAWEEVVTAARTIVTGVPTDPIEFRINVAASTTIQLGPCWTEGGRGQTRVPLPGIFKRAPNNISISSRLWPDTLQDERSRLQNWSPTDEYPALDDDGTAFMGHTVEFRTRLPESARWMTMRGEDYLTEASLESDIYEIDQSRDEIFYFRAIAELKRELGELVGNGVAEVQRRLAIDWDDLYDKEVARFGMKMARVPSSIRPMFSGPGGARSSRRVQFAP